MSSGMTSLDIAVYATENPPDLAANETLFALRMEIGIQKRIPSEYGIV
jgi:hypothetical protein